METRQRKILVNSNRILIFVLTVAALSMDGIQLSDVPGSLAVLVWLWADACLGIEAKILAVVRRAHPDRVSRHRSARQARDSSVSRRTLAWAASLTEIEK